MQRSIAAATTSVALVGAALVVPAASTSAAAGPAPVSSWTVVPSTVRADAIAYDATRHKVLAAIPGSVPGLGNDVVELDPSTGALSRSVFVGANPISLSVAADGTTLYVGLGGANRIVRVDLASFTVTSSFSVGRDSFVGPRVATQVAVVPGNDNEVVACLIQPGYTPPFADFVAYLNGSALANHDNATPANAFTFGAGASTLYAIDTQSLVFGSGLTSWALDSSGLSVCCSGMPNVVSSTTALKYGAGRLYTTDGQVLDPTHQTVATVAISGDAVDPVPSANRIYYVAGGVLREFRDDTRASVSSRTLTNGGPATTRAADLVSTNVGVAALLTDGSLYFAGPGIGPAATITPAVPPDHLSSIVTRTFPNQPVAAMIDDPFTATLLAAVPASSAHNANQIIEIDPATGAVGRHLLVGGDPDVLALSDDGSVLYVGLNSSPNVVVVDVSTFTKRSSFALGTDSSGDPLFAEAIAVEPGAPNTVALELTVNVFFPGEVGVAVYDSGVRRPLIAAQADLLDSLTFADATTLDATTVRESPPTFDVLTVDGQGAHVVAQAGGDPTGPILATRNGLAYVPGGVIDTSSLDLDGQFPTSIGAVDAPNDRAYAYDGVTGMLSEDELTTMRAVTAVPAPTGLTTATVVPTSAGFATFDGFGGGFALFVETSLAVKVSWTATETARIQQLGAYLGVAPSAVQKRAVLLVAYLLALAGSTSTTPWTPTPLGTATTYTTTWGSATLPALRAVERQFAVGDVDAHRVSVAILSYLVALQGH